MGYINAVALPDNIYQKKINQWRMMMTLIIVVTLSLIHILFWIETNETNKKRRNEYELYKQRH